MIEPAYADDLLRENERLASLYVAASQLHSTLDPGEVQQIIVEIKTVEGFQEVHRAQLLSYLRMTDCRLGLLINFNEVVVKDGVHRVVNGLNEL